MYGRVLAPWWLRHGNRAAFDTASGRAFGDAGLARMYMSPGAQGQIAHPRPFSLGPTP